MNILIWLYYDNLKDKKDIVREKRIEKVLNTAITKPEYRIIIVTKSPNQSIDLNLDFEPQMTFIAAPELPTEEILYSNLDKIEKILGIKSSE